MEFSSLPLAPSPPPSLSFPAIPNPTAAADSAVGAPAPIPAVSPAGVTGLLPSVLEKLFPLTKLPGLLPPPCPPPPPLPIVGVNFCILAVEPVVFVFTVEEVLVEEDFFFRIELEVEDVDALLLLRTRLDVEVVLVRLLPPPSSNSGVGVEEREEVREWEFERVEVPARRRLFSEGLAERFEERFGWCECGWL